MSGGKPRIRVTEVGEYIRHHSCERRFKLEFDDRDVAKQHPFASRFFNAIDPVLQESGRRREDDWEVSLQKAGILDLTNYQRETGKRQERVTEWGKFAKNLEGLGVDQDAYGREIQLEAGLGGFQIAGQVDFMLIRWKGGQPRLMIVECKASRRDRTYHRVQVALYRMMLRQVLQETPATIGGVALEPDSMIDCAVVRIDESTNEIQAILGSEPLDLEREESDIARLIAPGGPLARIVNTDLSELSYQLDLKCDGCVFNVHCLSESARERRSELLGIDPSTVRALRDVGITTIDDLAELDVEGPEAGRVRSDPGFSASLDVLRQKARARRKLLPGGDLDPDSYEVEPLPNWPQSQLPEHMIDGHWLVRVYLSVDYDYVENRVVALSAHVTRSDGQIHTATTWDEDGRPHHDPEVKERREVGRDDNDRPIYECDEMRGAKDVIEFIVSDWTGRYDSDTGMEKQLVQKFFHSLVEAIALVAGSEEAPIHFYVWSRMEMTRLIEACSRVDSRLLSHLRELLGCRESLEQLIFSCLQEEVDRRFALGWTGRGLAVVTSLKWFGQRYHWLRQVGNEDVQLDRVFTQDIFDFKTDLGIMEDGSWAKDSKRAPSSYKFEIRSRFQDALTVPYWRAFWRSPTLPSPDDPDITKQVKEAVRRYIDAARKPGYMEEYLRARLHALRWVEERIRFKNRDITKPLMVISELPDFDLGVADTARAAIDFLLLDQHVKVSGWISDHLSPPINRLPSGRTIPVKKVRLTGEDELTAEIDLDSYGIDLETLSANCSIGDGSFVRLNPYSGDPYKGQTFGQLVRGGVTCRDITIDWDTGEVKLIPISPRQTNYVLLSWFNKSATDVFDYATIDESVSDFVAGKVDDRLSGKPNSHVYQWFDPTNPRVPEQSTLEEDSLTLYRQLLEGLDLAGGGGLAQDQTDAALGGLDTRIQLLQGPPGTGKTLTTAAAALLRVLARRRPGDIVLVSAHTHTALDNLLERIDNMLDTFREGAEAMGLNMPVVILAKTHSSKDQVNVADARTSRTSRVNNFFSESCVRKLNKWRKGAVLIVGGTTGALLKMLRELTEKKTIGGKGSFYSPMLVIDEASMMVFPHFLALATAVHPEGEIMLAGDHRQLAPIVAHDWEREDRPPVIVYQPFVSAYQAVQDIVSNNPEIVSDRSISRSALSLTFRLPPAIRELIARLYRLDDIELEGLARDAGIGTQPEGGSWEQVWAGETGLFLVLHNERLSKRSNRTECQIIEQIIGAGGVLPDNSVAVVTPYRAQRSIMQRQLSGYRNSVDIIDTVERLQGGERPTVIVSATASDPSAISTNVEFILNLNRTNVAFSRSQDRLIVVCAEELINHIPAEFDHYNAAMLWKLLRDLCSQPVATIEVGGYRARVFTFTPPITSTGGTGK